MKLTKNELLEKINNLNKQKPLKENKEIQHAASPADADALEQHEEALKQNKERLDPKNYERDVRSLIEETASEDSRYRHFDVVDRRDLAKRINEARGKGLDFKVSRSAKRGFRYNLEVLNEDFLNESFMKKDAGDPNINCAAFNKATDVQASGPATALGEDVEEVAEVETQAPIEEDAVDYKGLVTEICSWLANNEDVESVSFPLIDHLVEIGYDEAFVNGLFEKRDEGEIDDGDEIEATGTEHPLDENLDEELKVYTSTLENFHPSMNCEEFWNEIVAAGKVGDLEYALETLYPDGISDVALDDLLSNEEDWIRDIIELPYGEEGSGESSDDESIPDPSGADEIDPELTDAESDDVEPVEFDDEGSEKEASQKGLKEEPLGKKSECGKDEVVECDGAGDDDKVRSLADGFINKNFKKNNCCEEDSKEEVKKRLAESEESEDEIVDLSEGDVDNMLGCPKKEEEK